MRSTQVARITAMLLVCQLAVPGLVPACSTFMLHAGDSLVFGHNLNENGIDVPGLVFINKRGTFKTGRTWSEIINKDGSNPSSLTWISRYGSVTFNVFGRDFPDGGMNEAGLYIWEMSETAEFPQNDELPRLMHMNWMQFVLDSYSTIDEVIQSAHEIEIDGWDWHFFVGDGRGKCASIAFADGGVVVHKDSSMPVPALFNEPYDREMEVLRFFQGFGGNYPVDLGSEHTPRVVKAAAMVRDYQVEDDPVEYAIFMLDSLKVAETPKWSIAFDATGERVYFKTRLHPSIKELSLEGIDFSNASPVQTLNIDIPDGRVVNHRLHPYDDKELFEFLMALPLPDEFFEAGGLTRSGFCRRATEHWRAALDPQRQGFKGQWKQIDESGAQPSSEKQWTLNLTGAGNLVQGTISRPSLGIEAVPIDHLRMQGDDLVFTFRQSPGGEIFEIRGTLVGAQLQVDLYGTEDYYGSFIFERAG